MKIGKYSFERGIIIILTNHGGRIGGTEWTTACYGISLSCSPLVYVQASVIYITLYINLASYYWTSLTTIEWLKE